ncbi:unnamed protein product [Amoebophrya sp. A25]|nr:unnamed protein product [Amoebophrya sp. A25]|eukprot:GSA25T00004453001.1
MVLGSVDIALPWDALSGFGTGRWSGGTDHDLVGSRSSYCGATSPPSAPFNTSFYVDTSSQHHTVLLAARNDFSSSFAQTGRNLLPIGAIGNHSRADESAFLSTPSSSSSTHLPARAHGYGARNAPKRCVTQFAQAQKQHLTAQGAMPGEGEKIVSSECVKDEKPVPFRCCREDGRGGVKGLKIKEDLRIPCSLVEKASYQEAVKVCKNNNAVICDGKALAQDAAQGTGCGFDGKAVRTSHTCLPSQVGTKMDGFSTVTAEGVVKCMKPSKKAAVRCCGKDGRAVKQMSTYGGSGGGGNYDANKCKQFEDRTFTEAAAVCKSKDLRICVDRKGIRESEGAGCNLNGKQMWTAQPCLLKGGKK